MVGVEHRIYCKDRTKKFPDRLDVAVKEKERSMITPSFFGLSTSKQAGVATSWVKEDYHRIGGRNKNFILNILSFKCLLNLQEKSQRVVA